MFGFGTACAVASVCILNLGIAYFDALYIIPMYYSLALLFQCGFGGIIYDEFRYVDAYHVFGFCFGVGINVLGVLLLSFSTANSAKLFPRTESCGVESFYSGSTWHEPNHALSSSIAHEGAIAPALRRTKSLKVVLQRSFSFDQARETLITPAGSEKSAFLALGVDKMVGQFADGGARLWDLREKEA